MTPKAVLVSSLFFMVAILLVGCRDLDSSASPARKALHDSTEWQIQPSFKYDVLTFLNTLTGDPFYLRYYQNEYTHFEPLLTTEAREALVSLKRKIKDDGGNIISAFLTLYFSATDDETLEEMLATLGDSHTMQENLKATSHYSDSAWALYESVKPELKTVFELLQEIDFPGYWRQTIRPRTLERIGEIEPHLPQYNVIREIESLLGHPLPSDKITVYMLYFSQPHGIRITGTRFLTDAAWSFSIVLRNAVHEMMHPPYDYTGDMDLREALDQLKADSFLMDKVENHNPSFGYNSFEGFVEEDVVQALEQVITERLGIARDARPRWKENDDGMHVLAVALYSVMQEERFADTDEHLRAFLIRQIETGKLQPGHLQAIHSAFYGTESERN